MKSSSEFYHALNIQTDLCIGCSHCMRACPTEALRVRNGKAELINNRCIDCGECYRVCPTHAISIEQDDFSQIFNYKVRIALIPSVLYGQFSSSFSQNDVHRALITIGFTDVWPVEDSVDYLVTKINEYTKNASHKPVISSFCPAIVRLIQVKFPSLVDNIALIRPPIDLTASYVKSKYIEEGNHNSDIGIFYVTPCAAKIVAVRRPEGDDSSDVTGIINMDFIYNKILKVLSNGNNDKNGEPDSKPSLGLRSSSWALTKGEAASIHGKALAIDGIWNVIEFLEMVENEELTGVDYLELRACDESCAGGILAPGNRFLTAENMLRDANSKVVWSIDQSMSRIKDYQKRVEDIANLKPLKPRSMLKLDEDMVRAMGKMERVNRLMCYLPGIDCGVCGAPSCVALAEDIVQGNGALSQCVFLQKIMENNKLNPEHSFRIMKKIWGENRFKKDCDKPIK
ncbi:[Fe-Fe] hydrogenase large subunit C-terminal domain-containing protein [Tenuifilum thalassicum]|uniref:4Fe-4S dicluster domain-containing protein n=1 Tax=Tenuifilum thalassicum TaxID=2590900 RepID=A0A7D4BKW3_9BACT|nr:[Fe-Fe] hydrogenase large subunit C-terminal domain-containing protein [Tenuifilum thalassicum]QKG80519.1 4Fe-4S dicluster domain-containing protein [Tenuifilum thalassicum]